jgi:hypothetical protein
MSENRDVSPSVKRSWTIGHAMYRLARRDRRRRDRVEAQHRDDGLALVRTSNGPG